MKNLTLKYKTMVLKYIQLFLNHIDYSGGFAVGDYTFVAY